MELISGGPFEAVGSYRISATLYNSAGPVPAVTGGATCSTSPAVMHAPSSRLAQNQDLVLWHCGLVLPGAHVDACSHVVLQVHCQKPSLLGVPTSHAICSGSGASFVLSYILDRRQHVGPVIGACNSAMCV